MLYLSMLSLTLKINTINKKSKRTHSIAESIIYSLFFCRAQPVSAQNLQLEKVLRTNGVEYKNKKTRVLKTQHYKPLKNDIKIDGFLSRLRFGRMATTRLLFWVCSHCHLNAAQYRLFFVVQVADELTEVLLATEVLQEFGEHVFHAGLEYRVLHEVLHQLVVLVAGVII